MQIMFLVLIKVFGYFISLSFHVYLSGQEIMVKISIYIKEKTKLYPQTWAKSDKK